MNEFRRPLLRLASISLKNLMHTRIFYIGAILHPLNIFSACVYIQLHLCSQKSILKAKMLLFHHKSSLIRSQNAVKCFHANSTGGISGNKKMAAWKVISVSAGCFSLLYNIHYIVYVNGFFVFTQLTVSTSRRMH